jgi:hypothetical protein
MQAREKEREKESYVCHKTHENTSIGSRREEMKSLWVTAYKEQTLKQKRTHESDMEVAKLQTPSSRRDLGGNKISARKKKYKHSKNTTPQKKGGGWGAKDGNQKKR